MSHPTAEADELPRPYGPWFAAALVAASMVGVGIFVTPFYTVAACGSLYGSLILWLFGGAYALCGAAMLASVATARPKSGGEYLYVAEAYGPAAGYLYGWATLLLGFAGPIAAVALAAAQFLMKSATPGLPSGNLSDCAWCARLAAILIAGIGVWHCLGPKASERLQIAATGFKLALLFLLVSVMGALAVLRPPPTPVGFSTTVNLGEPIHPAAARLLELERMPLAERIPAAFGMLGFQTAAAATLRWLAPIFGSFAFVVFTYTGWNAAAYVAGEVRDPARNLPKTLLLACLGVTAFYLLAAFGLTAWLPELADRGIFGNMDNGASFAFERAFGTPWLFAFNGVVGLGMLATVSAFIVTGARVMYAMAKSGHFPAFAGRWHPTRGPVAALLTLAAAAAAIALVGSVKDLLEYVGGGLAATGVVLGSAALALRRKPDFKPAFVPIFDPLPTWAFTIMSALIALAFAIAEPKKSAFGMLAILFALPFCPTRKPPEEAPP